LDSSAGGYIPLQQNNYRRICFINNSRKTHQFVNIRTLRSGWMLEKLQRHAGISRRSLGRMTAALVLESLWPRRSGAETAALLEVDRFVGGFAGADAGKIAFTYRADAVIVLFSLPVYRRPGVGSGFASLAEAGPEGARCYSLRFAGASRPERAAGLDRVGVIREVARERAAKLNEAAYFGVLTSSPEETLEEGRRSLGKTGNKWNEYTAINGLSRGGGSRSAVAHFRLPSSGSSNVHLIAEARANFQNSQPAWRENQWAGNQDTGAPPTFLYGLMKAIRDPRRSSETRYVFSDRSYRLRLEKEPDRQQGRRFAELGLTSQPERVVEVRGRIREERSGRQTTFRLWIEDGAANTLPLRIEFQPRSYLRLSFEVDRQASATSLEEEL